MLGKHISVVRALCYIVAQCIGATIGSAIAKVVTNGRQFESVYGGTNVISLGISEERAFLGEASHSHLQAQF
jgi:glycerol uptake facilitator-like aquaporin